MQCFYVFLCGFAVFLPPLYPPLLLVLTQKCLMQTLYLVAKRICLGGILVAIQPSYGPIPLDQYYFGVTHLYGGPVHDVRYAIISWEKSAVPWDLAEAKLS